MPGAVGGDAEALHQARVASRRIREALPLEIRPPRKLMRQVRRITRALGPVRELDVALMVDVYHELAQPQAFLRSLKRAIRPSGQLVLIEFRKESPWVPIREEHKMSIRDARMELEAEGYDFDRVLDVLPWQHILVFRPRQDRREKGE